MSTSNTPQPQPEPSQSQPPQPQYAAPQYSSQGAPQYQSQGVPQYQQSQYQPQGAPRSQPPQYVASQPTSQSPQPSAPQSQFTSPQYTTAPQPYAPPQQAAPTQSYTPQPQYVAPQPQPYAQQSYAQPSAPQPQPQPALQPAYPALQPAYPAPQPQYYQPVSPVKSARRIMRSAVNRPAGLVLLYTAIAQALNYVLAFALSAAYFAQHPSTDMATAQREMTRLIVESMGVISLLGFGAAAVVLVFVDRRQIVRRGFWTDAYGGTGTMPGAGRMRASWLLEFIVLLCTTQVLYVLLQRVFNALGASSASPTMDMINQSAINWQMWLYVGLVGPILEEIVFRGVLLQSLAPYGRNFAIVTSALMFGLYHSDFSQGLFAFVVGLLLGYVGLEYSILWSIALHVFNNAVLGGLLPSLANAAGPVGVNIYGYALLGVGVIGGIAVLVRHRRELRWYVGANRSPRGTYWGWTSPWFLVYVGLELALVVSSLITVFSAR